MVRVVLSGVCGRTGSLVARALIESPDTELVAGIESPGHEWVGRRLCDVWPDTSAAVPLVGSLDNLEAPDYDVLVDFTTPEQAVACARSAAAAGKGLVIGTTGLETAQLEEVERAAESCAVVLAPNTSVGANVLFALLDRAAAALGDAYDVEIVEAHHAAKKDAPSGTALRAAEVVARARGAALDDVLTLGRTGPDTRRASGEIAVHSIRGGAVAGRHDVHFLAEHESLTVTHEALSRRAFALGAVRAAIFVAGSPPGLYDMQDVLGLRDTGRGNSG